MGQRKLIQGRKLNKIGTDYSISLDYVQGVEHPIPVMYMPSGHGDW